MSSLETVPLEGEAVIFIEWQPPLTVLSFLTPWPWAWPLQVLCRVFFWRGSSPPLQLARPLSELSNWPSIIAPSLGGTWVRWTKMHGVHFNHFYNNTLRERPTRTDAVWMETVGRGGGAVVGVVRSADYRWPPTIYRTTTISRDQTCVVLGILTKIGFKLGWYQSLGCFYLEEHTQSQELQGLYTVRN